MNDPRIPVARPADPAPPGRPGALRRRLLRAGALAALPTGVGGLHGPARADEPWPARTVRIVNWSNPGGNMDIVSRLLGEHASRRWGQSVITDNKVGASGIIATEFVARSPADGYTLLMTTSTGQVANALLRTKLPYDPVKDFEPLSLLLAGNIALFAAPEAPYGTLRELLEHARKVGRPLNYGSFGIGTSAHLYGEAFRRQSGVPMTHVPYKTGEQGIMSDVIGGSLDLGFMSQGNAKIHSQAGKIKLIAISGTQRTKALAALPTFGEQGYTGFGLAGWIATYAPAGTPRPIVNRIAGTLRETLQIPEVSARLESLGYDILGSSPDELRTFQQDEMKRFAELVRQAGITPE